MGCAKRACTFSYPSRRVKGFGLGAVEGSKMRVRVEGLGPGAGRAGREESRAGVALRGTR